MNRDHCDSQFVVLEAKWLIEGREAVLINVYVPNTLAEQKALRGELVELKNGFTSRWIMGGNFNDRSERSNCVGLMNGWKEFSSFIDI